jgi:hypothetical protein
MSDWITVNKPYKKRVPTLNLEILLESDHEYVTLLDKILRTKHEETFRESFDISRYDFLTSAYLDRKVPYETWEFKEEFENMWLKASALNERLGELLQPLYIQLEERRAHLINYMAKKAPSVEALDSFVTLSLPEGTLELYVELPGKQGNIVLTSEVKHFIETFIDTSCMYVVAYRVVEKPSILTRIGKRLGLCT